MKVYKYPFMASDDTSIITPRGSVLLSIQVQKGVPTAWFLVDEKETQVEVRQFKIFGTDHDVEGQGAFITTLQMFDGRLVLHVFEKENSDG